jgi:Uma2 family endonuclease
MASAAYSLFHSGQPDEIPRVSKTMSRYVDVPGEWTYSEYARLPDDGNHYEVLDGEVLVTPAPGTRHQRIVGRLFIAQQPYVEGHGLGEIFYDIDLLFASGHFLRPDLLFVPNAEREGITDRGMERTPGLVVEVLSPSSRSIDLVKKPRRYADFGLPEFWVADPSANVILRFDLRGGIGEPSEHRDRIFWQPSPEIAALIIEIPPIFR